MFDASRKRSEKEKESYQIESTQQQTSPASIARHTCCLCLCLRVCVCVCGCVATKAKCLKMRDDQRRRRRHGFETVSVDSTNRSILYGHPQGHVRACARGERNKKEAWQICVSNGHADVFVVSVGHHRSLSFRAHTHTHIVEDVLPQAQLVCALECTYECIERERM